MTTFIKKMQFTWHTRFFQRVVIDDSVGRGHCWVIFSQHNKSWRRVRFDMQIR